MKKTERVLTYTTDISKRTLDNLSYFHELIHLFYNIVKKDKNVKLMSWTMDKIVNKHDEIAKALNRKSKKHFKTTELDQLRPVQLKKTISYDATFDNLHDFMNKTDFDFIKDLNLYRYNAGCIIESNIKSLKKAGTIDLMYNHINVDEMIEFVERFPNMYLITNSDNEKHKILLNLKSDIKPLTCVLKNKSLFKHTKVDHDQICIIHRLNTIRKTKIQIEGKIPEMNKKALNRIKNNIKKIADKNYIAVGKFVKKGKKHMIEIHDVIYYNKRDLSKEPVKVRKELLDKLFDDNNLTHIMRK